MSKATQRRRKAHEFGNRAEWAAVALLRLKGYRILATRFSVPGGEIDVIAARGDTIAFVEVKARPTLDQAMLAISATKRQRISRAASFWLSSNPWAANRTWRGDAIYIAPWHWPRHAIAAVELQIG